LKILFYIESLRSGGKERRLVELIKGLKKYPNIEMELVLTKEEIHYTDIFDTGIKIHYTIRKGLKKDPRLFWKFYKIAREFRPDIIHVWGNMVAVYAIPTKLILKIPMVNNQITDAPLKVSKGLLGHRLTFLFTDNIIANSFAGIKVYNAPDNKSFVIYNGFDFDRISRLENKGVIKKRIKISTPFIVGMVASFSELKDYKTYLQSANVILENRNDITFLCIGSGDDSDYRKMITEKKKDKVLFLGRQEDVLSIMNICDVGVLTSYTEGISNSLMEFMALGKPVIYTGAGGTGELIQQGETGFLINTQNVRGLISKILFFIKHSESKIEIGNHARRVIKNKFGIDKMIESFYNRYLEML